MGRNRRRELAISSSHSKGGLVVALLVLFLVRLTGRTRAQEAWDLPERARQAVERQSSLLEGTEAASWDTRDTIDRSGWDDGSDGQDLAESPAEGESSTIAKMLDDRLKEEFKDKEVDGKQYNETVLADESKQETVVRITQTSKTEEPDTDEDGDGIPETTHRSEAVESEVGSFLSCFLLFSFSPSLSWSWEPDGSIPSRVVDKDVPPSLSRLPHLSPPTSHPHLTPTSPPPSPLTHRSPVPPADRIIDSHDNEYVLSKPNIEGSLGLTLDPQLIRDMSLLIITSALAGQLMSALGQPTINGE